MLAKRRNTPAVLAAVAATLLAAALTALAGCGAPKYEYVKNSEQKTYFKVPSTWHRLDQAELDQWVVGDNPDSATARIRKQLIWTVAYDADPEPAVGHVYSPFSTEEPVVWAKVEQLLPAQRDIVSFDVLRNLVLPVTEDSRAAAQANQSLMDGFELLHDEVLTPRSGLHGVRVVFNYRLPMGAVQTFDQTVLSNDDASLIYLLFVRCSARCYAERADELAEVVSSFTVRSK